MTSEKKIKTLIVSGFLGSGKTSFVNHLIQQLDKEKTIIIENEFGEVGIDGQLIKSNSGTLFEISNGCVCCDLNTELTDTLREVMEIPTCEYLIIETTGIADPSTVAASFYSSMKIEAAFCPIYATCLVDVDLIEQRLEETDEALRQIAFASTIVLNKIDLVSQEKLDEVEKLLSEINPIAKIFKAKQGQIIPEIDLKNQFFDKEINISKKENSHHHHHHHKGISSFTFHIDKPINIHSLVNRLYVLQMLNSHQIYRVKGIIYSKEFSEKTSIQSVGKHIDVDHIGPWAENETKQSAIVVIGRNIQKESVEKIILQCVGR
jgi:G3E family GTPase